MFPHHHHDGAKLHMPHCDLLAEISSSEDFSEQQQQHSILKLINFNENHDDLMNLNFHKLKDKMRSRKRVPKAFSQQFKCVGLIGEKIITRPYDVKISYKLGYIIVSDYGAHLIHMFDLITKEFKRSLKSGYPMYLEIDEYHAPHSDALLVACEIFPARCVYKYDVLTLISKQSDDDFVVNPSNQLVIVNKNYLWKTKNLGWPQGIACTPNYVYVCDSYSDFRCVHKFNRQTGIEITTIHLNSPCYGIAVARHENQFFVSQEIGDVVCVEISNDHQYFITICSKEPNCKSQCQGLVYDRALDIVLGVSPSFIIIKIDEKMLTENQSMFFQNAHGLCLNELEGELYICNLYDSDGSSTMIVK
ncbi:hypothetical protein FDP41_003077 [Naegleria fowleri]|uniref:SMP-30/Gluconolactonase/LRE-like region domain-containing protein n=1 Tax=Naegleria fowleri TaxID=5763 RepID=A0A6A5BWR0_NAEFO|nr:uncharacterized protein FDP41_003077 [Naegleria fowleri]KAF0977755.1 hypothetical protein FDP41_003077 [Naegleria fowleri]CAG4715451.1 unnamed protein product [Naegleria fowleri]